jgi:hypothetical protein
MGRRFRQSGYRRICTRFRWFINGAVYESGQSHIELFDNGIINRWPQSRAPSTAHEVVVSIKWVKDWRHLVPHLVTFGQSCQNFTYSEIFLINNCQCQNEVKNHTVPP